MNANDSQLLWRDITMTGKHRPGAHVIETIEGWEELPPDRSLEMNRPNRHGSFPAPVLLASRRVVVTGHSYSSSDRDALLEQMRASATPGAVAEPLQITLGDTTLTAYGIIARYKATLSTYRFGMFGWAIEWRCSDPYRYGQPVTLTTGPPVGSGGLRLPMMTDGAGTIEGVAWFGPRGNTATLSFDNPRNADAYPVFTAAGPLPGGFTVREVETGRRVTFAGNVPTGSEVVIDTAEGTALLDGVERSTQLTSQEWSPTPAYGSASYAFLPGAGYGAAATLSVTVTPTSW